MQQVLTIKLKILPDEAGKKLLEETMAAYSRACSFVAERIAEDHLPLNRCSIHKAVYRSCREQFSLPSQMSASVIRTVTASFRSIKTSKERHPSRFSKKKRNSLTVPRFRVPQVSLVWNRDYSLVWDKSHTQRLLSHSGQMPSGGLLKKASFSEQQSLCAGMENITCTSRSQWIMLTRSPSVRRPGWSGWTAASAFLPCPLTGKRPALLPAPL